MPDPIRIDINCMGGECGERYYGPTFPECYVHGLEASFASMSAYVCKIRKTIEQIIISSIVLPDGR